jgi:hypothetical protein
MARSLPRDLQRLRIPLGVATVMLRRVREQVCGFLLRKPISNDTLSLFSDSSAIVDLFGARRLSQHDYPFFPEPRKSAYAERSAQQSLGHHPPAHFP